MKNAWKKILSLLLPVVMLLSFTAIPASADNSGSETRTVTLNFSDVGWQTEDGETYCAADITASLDTDDETFEAMLIQFDIVYNTVQGVLALDSVVESESIETVKYGTGRNQKTSTMAVDSIDAETADSLGYATVLMHGDNGVRHPIKNGQVIATAYFTLADESMKTTAAKLSFRKGVINYIDDAKEIQNYVVNTDSEANVPSLEENHTYTLILNGEDSIQATTEAFTKSYAAVVSEDGVANESLKATLSATGLSDGVTFDESAGVLTIPASLSKDVTVTITATYATASDSKTVTIKAAPNLPDSKYTVTWKNEDGTVLETDENVEAGTTPSYDGETPAKAATAEYTYAFNGWNPEISVVTGDVTYIAVFTETKNKYTVTWKNEDGTVLETDENVEYGAVPTYDGAEPTKTATAEYTYTFNGWNPEVAAVTSHATYTAQFTETEIPRVEKYTVTWKHEDGTVLETDNDVEAGVTPTYDGSVPTKAATAEYTYTFSGWEPNVSPITGNVTYTAVFTATKNIYTVTWKNEDGSVLETDGNIEYGAVPSYDGTEPTKAATAEYAYTFNGWNPEVTAVTGDVTYTAVFTEIKNKYTVTWKNEDGTVLETDEGIEYGAIPAYDGAEPTKAATAEYTYTFNGWNPEVSAVSGNTDYVATFIATAIPQVEKYTVTWKNDDGSILEVDEDVEAGMTPSYDGETPTKAATAEYAYTFNGWQPQVSPVTGDITYTAVFTSTKNRYTVTWKNEDGSVLELDEDVEYGVIPAYDGAEPSKTATAQYSYAFSGWNPEISAVTGDVTYTAVFTETEKSVFTVTFNSNGGSQVEEQRVEIGKTVVKPDNPTRSGYSFDAWYQDASLRTPYDFNAPVNGDLTLHAKWTENGCYVATAVYGSYDCPEVWTLRRFRDDVLAQTWYGRLFIRLYYAVSPTAVRLFGDCQWFQNFFRDRLDEMVSGLQADGFESTPYEDRAW